MSNTEYTNDLSLLRPFDLEAAKNGEEIVTIYEPSIAAKLIAGPDKNGVICLIREVYGLSLWDAGEQNDVLRMKPLCWVEGKPVYKGDVLWYKEYDYTILFSVKVEGYNPHINNKSGLIGKVMEVTDKNTCGYKGGETTWAPWNMFTWNKPKQKVKRKIWINVYPDHYGTTYSSKHEAELNAIKTRLALVETEIEYEV